MIRDFRSTLVSAAALAALALLPATSRPGVSPAAAYAAPQVKRGAATAPAPAPAADGPAAIRRRMVAVLLDETNRERNERRLPALVLSSELAAAAQAHAEDMLARGYFSHENPEGESSAERVFRIAPRAIVLSVRENILKTEGNEDDAPHVRAIEIVAGWMGSTGHRENLLAEDVAEVGFGVASRMESGRLVEYSVQVLGRVAGTWSDAPHAVRAPERLRARLTVPVEFFLEDTAHPKRRYKDPYDAALSWVGGIPLVVVAGHGASLVELPRLDPGRYRLLGRLAHDEGYQTVREIRILGAFEQG